MQDSPEETTHPTTGGSRRDFIRRSAVIGGTLAWTVPTVSQAAFAQGGPPIGSPGEEPPCEDFYQVKYDLNDDPYSVGDTVDPASGVLISGANDCLAAAAAGLPNGSGFVQSVTVTAVDGDGQPTEVQVVVDGAAQFHNGRSKCARTGCEPATTMDNMPPTDDTVTFFACPGSGSAGGAISHVELIFCIP